MRLIREKKKHSFRNKRRSLKKRRLKSSSFDSKSLNYRDNYLLLRLNWQLL
jgi:hypothetical protein